MKQSSTHTSDSVKSNDFIETIQINKNNLTAEEYEAICRLARKSKSYFKDEMPANLTPVYGINAVINKLYKIPFGYPDSKLLYKAGFLHLSEQEAITDFDIRYVMGKLRYLSKHSAEPYNPWDGKSRHYFIGYLPDEDRLVVSSTVSMKTGATYFASEEAAREAIDIIGETSLKDCLKNS
jgi:hypothetical protein